MNILQEADKVAGNDRSKDYGHPHVNHTRIAAMWSQILGYGVTWRQVLLCMIATKISRECHSPKHDNLVDIAGYARCIEMCNEYRGTEEQAPPVHDHEALEEEDRGGPIAKLQEVWKLRNGSEVVIIPSLPSMPREYSIQAVVISADAVGEVLSYTSKGMFQAGKESEYDLMEKVR